MTNGLDLKEGDEVLISNMEHPGAIDGVEASKVVEYVREKYNLVVRTIGSRQAGTYAVRVSTPIYISFKEIDMLLEGINHLVRHKA